MSQNFDVGTVDVVMMMMMTMMIMGVVAVFLYSTSSFAVTAWFPWREKIKINFHKT